MSLLARYLHVFISTTDFMFAAITPFWNERLPNVTDGLQSSRLGAIALFGIRKISSNLIGTTGVAVQKDYKIQIFSTINEGSKRIIDSKHDLIDDSLFTSDGKRIVLKGRLGKLKLINTKNGKTIQDLIASIKDGRYKCQKSRMLKYKKQHSKKIILVYFIEGDFTTISTYDKKMYWGSVVNTSLRDEICVLQTPDLEGTSKLVLDIYKKVKDNKFETPEKSNIEIHLESFKKNSFQKPDNYFQAQLKLIPGVSTKIASVLENTFLTMNLFIRISKENINKQGNIDFLKNVMIGKRKIGEVLAYKILEFILYNEDDLENIKKPKIK